jgi:hypothetical protein
MLGAHLTVNNLLHIAFVLLCVGSHFHAADVVSYCAYAIISILYLQCNVYSRYIQLVSLSGPLSWTLIACYWTNAFTLRISNLLAHLVALLPLWITFCGYAFRSISAEVRIQ